MLPSCDTQTVIVVPSTVFVYPKPLPGVPLHADPAFGTSRCGSFATVPPRPFTATSDAAASITAKPR